MIQSTAVNSTPDNSTFQYSTAWSNYPIFSYEIFSVNSTVTYEFSIICNSTAQKFFY